MWAKNRPYFEPSRKDAGGGPREREGGGGRGERRNERTNERTVVTRSGRRGAREGVGGVVWWDGGMGYKEKAHARCVKIVEETTAGLAIFSRLLVLWFLREGEEGGGGDESSGPEQKGGGVEGKY